MSKINRRTGLLNHVELGPTEAQQQKKAVFTKLSEMANIIKPLAILIPADIEYERILETQRRRAPKGPTIILLRDSK